MIKYYFKQAWELMKQQRLFTLIYVAGTALALCFTTVMAVAYYVKLAPLYPEGNRSHTYYTDWVRISLPEKDNYNYTSSVSYRLLKDHLYGLKNAEAVSGMLKGNRWVKLADGKEVSARCCFTDPAFFRIYDFEFKGGTPFSEADLESGVRSVVMTTELARRIFGTDQDLVGRTFQMDNLEYRVCGVVRGGSNLLGVSYAQMYMPYTTREGYADIFYYDYLGGFFVCFLVKDRAQYESLCQELDAFVASVNQQHEEEWVLEINHPRSHAAMVFENAFGNGTASFSVWMVIRHVLPLLLVLLLIPAINLSGLISSRMEERLPEVGVRKVFGAGRRTLFSQIIWENLLLTLAGGIVGMLLAWMALYWGRDWVFSLFGGLYSRSSDNVVTAEMLFSPMVFFAAFLICLLLNLLSALVPAWNSLRHPIVESLYEKR